MTPEDDGFGIPRCTGPFSNAFDCPVHHPAEAPAWSRRRRGAVEMSLDRICERCDEEHSEWRVWQAVFDVGKLQSKIYLCEACTRTVQELLRRALKRKDR